jgi:hypothetical protein
MLRIIMRFIKNLLKYIYYALLFIWESLVRLVIINLSNGSKKFGLIYKLNYWSGPFSNRSVSGYGSDKEATQNIVSDLESFIKQHKIKTILDIPCGDFSWMKNVNFNGAEYIGADIVEDLILSNKLSYTSESTSFKVMDVTSDLIPEVDLVFVRDCFIHLSNQDVTKAISNIKRSKSCFFAATTFSSEEVDNKNIITGDFRFINLLKKPFELPEPFDILDDGFDNKDKIYSCKKISIWKLDELE